VRWDPHRENEVFFKQSALLHANFYQIQIVAHRPFITSSKRTSPLAFPSLAICTNAARSTANILDILNKRMPEATLPQVIVRMICLPAGILFGR
jgi:hypothetical protein